MTHFNWDDSYSVNVQEMDTEHQKLIYIMNDLNDLHDSTVDDVVIEQRLKDLVDYTSLHFADEEEYMESIGHENLENHRKIHKDLLSKLRNFAKDFATSRKLEDSFFVFLKIWLSAHIKGIDAQYKKDTLENAG